MVFKYNFAANNVIPFTYYLNLLRLIQLYLEQNVSEGESSVHQISLKQISLAKVMQSLMGKSLRNIS